MTLTERQVIADRVVQHYQKYGKKKTIDHFAEEGENVRTLNRIILNYLRTGRQNSDK